MSCNSQTCESNDGQSICPYSLKKYNMSVICGCCEKCREECLKDIE